tara:strand:- start:43 stop:507 length:465 start_codon:yes stop_codon:yes gene_type:complete
MIKKTLILLLLILTTSCGYEALYSKKNITIFNFSVVEMNFNGDRNVNLKIKEKLSKLSIKKFDKEFKLQISTTSERKVLAKDVQGDPTSFENTITTNIEAIGTDQNINKFEIKKSYNYNNIENKFNLSKYERELKNNIAETIARELIFKLSNIQ